MKFSKSKPSPIFSVDRAFTLIARVVPLTLVLGTPVLMLWSQPTYSQSNTIRSWTPGTTGTIPRAAPTGSSLKSRAKDSSVQCVAAAKRILSKATRVRANTRKFNITDGANQLCALRISSRMQMRAARQALVNFYGARHAYRFYLGKVKGVNEYAPSILIFGQRARRIDPGEISTRALSARLGFVAVSNHPDNPPVITVSSSPPHHVGLAKAIIENLARLKQRGPYRVEAIAGHPVAPVLFIRSGTGKRFAYSYSIQDRLLDRRLYAKLVPDLSKIKNWAPMVRNRLKWTQFMSNRERRRGKAFRQSLSDFLVRPAHAGWGWLPHYQHCSRDIKYYFLKNGYSVPNYNQSSYGGKNDCGPTAAAMALAYFNKYTPGLVVTPLEIEQLEKEYDYDKGEWLDTGSYYDAKYCFAPGSGKKYFGLSKNEYFNKYSLDKNKCTAKETRHKLIYDLSVAMDTSEASGTWDCGIWLPDWLAWTVDCSEEIGASVKGVAMSRNYTMAQHWWTGESDNTKFSTFNYHMNRNNPVLLMIGFPGSTAYYGAGLSDLEQGGPVDNLEKKDITYKEYNWYFKGKVAHHWMTVIGTAVDTIKFCFSGSLCLSCSSSSEGWVAVRSGWVESGPATKPGYNAKGNEYMWLYYEPDEFLSPQADWYYVRINDMVGGKQFWK